MSQIGKLRKKIEDIESKNCFDGKPYPPGLTKFPGVLTGQGFFPGGDGLWRDDPASTYTPPFPEGGIMILGNDLGCEDNPDPQNPGFKQCLDRGFEDPKTWSIKDTLIKAGSYGIGILPTAQSPLSQIVFVGAKARNEELAVAVGG